MFTGLVEALGTVTRLEARPKGRWFELELPATMDGLAIGDSIAVNGCCLTVVERADEPASIRVALEAVPETLARTTIGELRRGDVVNLERALRLGDRLGGHLVQGHVDGVGTVRAITTEGTGRRMRFEMPVPLAPFVAGQGSIAIDGISFTIAACDKTTFEVSVIPHTLEHTVARSYRDGTRVNLEVDLVARYLARMLETGLMERSKS